MKHSLSKSEYKTMSYRATAITEYIYDVNKLEKIADVLSVYGDFKYEKRGHGTGYFHGVIKELYNTETQAQEKEITDVVLSSTGVRLKMIHE